MNRLFTLVFASFVVLVPAIHKRPSLVPWVGPLIINK